MIGRQRSGGSWWALVGAATLAVFLAGAVQAATINVPADYATIQAAVNSATPGDTINVAAGTYPERLTVNKPLTLTGAGRESSFIDATSFLTAGNVVTITALTGDTTINGFGITTGIYSTGILASGGTDALGHVTISNNHILSPNDPASEPSPQFGIIVGYGDVRHIIISGNEISNTFDNSILAEKQVGPTDITGNLFNGGYPTVFFMTYGGVTVTGLQYVSGNTFDYSTADAGTGASAVAFSSATHFVGVPSRTGKYANVEVFDNTVTGLNDAGFKGISVGETSADGIAGGFDSLIIHDNKISGAAGRGIQLYGHIVGADIHNNTFTGLSRGIYGFNYLTAFFPEGNEIHGNSVSGASDKLVFWTGTTNFDVTNNWWGTATPAASSFSANVTYSPWLAAIPGTDPMHYGYAVVAGGTVDGTGEGIPVTATVTGAGTTVTLEKYDGDPTGSTGFGSNFETGYVDVLVPNVTGVTQVEVRLYYLPTVANETTLELFWWDGTSWVKCSNQGVSTANFTQGGTAYGGYLWAKITTLSVPNLNQLTGTIFGGGSGPSPSTIWYENFEYVDNAAFLAAGWAATPGTTWHLTNETAVPSVAYNNLVPFPSSIHAAYFGSETTRNYSGTKSQPLGVMTPQAREAQALVQPKGAGEGYPYGELTSPNIGVSGLTGVNVSFHYFREVECYSLGSYDRTYAQARFGSGPWQTIWTRDSKVCTAMESWQATGAIPVVVPAGATTMQIRFVFDAVDNVGNGYLGWLIDDVEVLQQQNPGPGPSALAIATSCPLPGGTETQSYGPVQLQASGGTGPYTWNVTGLPSGLDCTTAGVVSGTPGANTAGASPYSVTLTVTDSAMNTASKTCSVTIAAAQQCPCDLALLNFESALTDQKLAQPWTTTGLWHVATNGCANCGTAGSNHYGYFGKDASCSYDNAGAAVTGYLTSPEVPLASCILNLAIGFNHYREVESYPGPASYDRTSVQVRWFNVGGWGDWKTIWLKDSTNTSPDNCLDVVIGPVAVPAGATKAQVRFGFESGDGVFNNFIGWAVDEIWVKNSTCASAPTTAPLSLSALQVKDVSRAEITVLNVPNPVRDVHTTTFSARGVGIEAMRIQIFDISQNLVFEEEVAGTELVWHTVDAYGEYLANGVYFYRALVLASGQWIATGFEKLVILR
jgi:hypothetical protein